MRLGGGMQSCKRREQKYLKPHDERNREVELLGCVDHALGNHVALHNPAKNVDEDGFDFGVTWGGGGGVRWCE